MTSTKSSSDTLLAALDLPALRQEKERLEKSVSQKRLKHSRLAQSAQKALAEFIAEEKNLSEVIGMLACGEQAANDKKILAELRSTLMRGGVLPMPTPSGPTAPPVSTSSRKETDDTVKKEKAETKKLPDSDDTVKEEANTPTEDVLMEDGKDASNDKAEKGDESETEDESAAQLPPASQQRKTNRSSGATGEKPPRKRARGNPKEPKELKAPKSSVQVNRRKDDRPAPSTP